VYPRCTHPLAKGQALRTCPTFSFGGAQAGNALAEADKERAERYWKRSRQSEAKRTRGIYSVWFARPLEGPPRESSTSLERFLFPQGLGMTPPKKLLVHSIVDRVPQSDHIELCRGERAMFPPVARRTEGCICGAQSGAHHQLSNGTTGGGL
jgi:hypothetical protein